MPVSIPHQSRASTLDTVARLAGFCEHVGVLPDGSRPDVLRACALSGNVFMGDAKESERPSDPAVGRRLARYMHWFNRNAACRGRGGIFALCVGSDADMSDWAALLDRLAESAGLIVDLGGRAIDTDTFVIWAYTRELSHVARSRAIHCF